MFHIIHGIQDMNHMLEVQVKASSQRAQAAIQSNGTEGNEGMSAMITLLSFIFMTAHDVYMKELRMLL